VPPALNGRSRLADAPQASSAVIHPSQALALADDVRLGPSVVDQLKDEDLTVTTDADGCT
jgi:hypothetical protein